MKKYLSGSSSLPYLLVSDENGRVFEIPELYMVGMSLNQAIISAADDLMRMPAGSCLFTLPGCVAIGYDARSNSLVKVEEYEGRPVQAVAAFMAPAHTQTLLAYFHKKKTDIVLPLFAYTAVGWKRGQFYVTGLRVDADIRQDADQFDAGSIAKAAEKMLKRYPRNRLVAHLVENCVRRYACPAAQNFVLERWEAPIPTSPVCNAQCLGCISKQPNGQVAVTQDRISFVPSAAEIVEYTVPHLQKAPRAIVSFGQGCEGEPLLYWPLLAESIQAMRRRTSRGTINLNTNASDPQAIEQLCRAGLDSLRVSLNSAQPEYYHQYYSPHNYSFKEVIESLMVARKFGKWISLNYFIFPGFTDHPQEIEALLEIVTKVRVNYIQMRNLNIDPYWYIEKLALSSLSFEGKGIRSWMAEVKKKAPWIRFGYYNPPKEDW